MRERLLANSARKSIVVASLTALALTGCKNTRLHAEGHAPSTQPSSTTLQDKAEQLLSEAYGELTDKVAKHQRVSLLVARGMCLYWPAVLKGIDTVVRNPAIYHYQKGLEEVNFLPFTPSRPPLEKLVIMDGPFLYTDKSNPENDYGNMNAVIFSKDFPLFNLEKETVELRQVSKPSPYTPAWMQASDGSKIGETQLIEDKNLQKAFSGACHLQPLTESA